MKVIKSLRNRFYKTPAFKGLINSFEKENKVKVVPVKVLQKKDQELAQASQDKIELEAKIPTLVSTTVKEEIQKIDTMNRNEALRYRNIKQINTYTNPDRKPNSDVSFSYLRRMAQVYPVARACINRRIRQITQLEWDITTVDDIEGEKGHEQSIGEIKQFFKHPMGHKTRMRELLTLIIDDLLTVDAISFEYQKTRGGDLMHLVPIDPTTIALRVTETGGTPEPPDAAYVQFIGGKKIAEFSTDEVFYDKMGNRSYTPYGVAPIESLILQVESAMHGALYNLSYLKENNVPEGFVTLPEEVAANKSQVEEWQAWFDALMAGNDRMTHRLKFLPGNSEYLPTKKPEDMSFERFELWLLQQTCAVFDVQPQDIGITLHVNKSTGENQSDIGVSRGLIPLANFIKEVFDEMIQENLGYEKLQFAWGNFNPVDRKEEAEVAQIEIDRGIKSVDEIRIAQGQKPIGLGHYIMTASGPMFVKDLVGGKVGPAAAQATSDKSVKDNSKPGGNNDNGGNNSQGDTEKMEQLETAEIRRWKKAIINDIEAGRAKRTKFPSEYISAEIHEEISKGLEIINSKQEAKSFFDMYLDPEIKASMTLLKYSRELKQAEQNALSA